ncbi:MAG: DNA-protecting protein DprA [Paracoccus denitrificans]|nr:MAG: DNA-protecting protein DprA [Paracoccus denitrificans]PZO85189.1 MAG: DNA-protecting protein DprA [Paracoccus denitrificans]
MFQLGRPRPPSSRSDDGLIAQLRLIRSRRVGPATFHRLMAEHGDAQTALDALPAIGRTAGIADYQPFTRNAAIAEMRAGAKAGARLVAWDGPDYPGLLRDLADAPPLIWVKGDVATLARPTVAVIGARNASTLGLRMARGMAHGLTSAGLMVVSGLARGIDTAAHEAALDCGTIAVMAGGIDVIYPRENAGLAAEIVARGGALITEQPPGIEPVARHFPARNRIIAGLSRAVVVVEAAHRSGSLVTARMAIDAGREVLAVPGHPMDSRAGGCNALIRDGAVLVRNADDVVAAMGFEGPIPQGDVVPMVTAAPHQAAPPDNLHARILARLGPSPTEEDAILRDLGLTMSEAAGALMELELSGQLVRSAGARLALAG